MRFDTALLLGLAAAIRPSCSLPTKISLTGDVDRLSGLHVPRALFPVNHVPQVHGESSSSISKRGSGGNSRSPTTPRTSNQRQKTPKKALGEYDAYGELIIEDGSVFTQGDDVIEVGDVLGQGANGQVNYVRLSKTKKEPKTGEPDAEDSDAEDSDTIPSDPDMPPEGALKVSHGSNNILHGASIQALVSHANVVKVLKTFRIRDENGKPSLRQRQGVITEYMEEGDLMDWYEKEQEAMIPTKDYSDKVVNLMLGASDGVLAVHAAGYVHRDIKPKNLMLKYLPLKSGKKELEAALGDFDLAKQKGRGKDNKVTPNFAPPEVGRNEEVLLEGIDVWGLLATTVEMITPNKLGRYGQRLVDRNMIGGGKTPEQWAKFLGMSSMSKEYAALLNRGFRKHHEWMTVKEFQDHLVAIDNFYGEI